MANLIISATKVTTPAPIPKYPINSAILSSLSSKGVLLSSWALSTVLLIIPFWECSPTAMTIPLPLPSIQLVPDKIKGEGNFFSPLCCIS